MQGCHCALETWSSASIFRNLTWDDFANHLSGWKHKHINTLRPRQDGRHFADDTFNRIFVNENVKISIEFSLKFVPKGPINNIPASVQIMAWRRPGDKLLSEPVMVSLLTHICVTRPQWVKMNKIYRQISNTRRNQYHHLNVSRIFYQLLLSNPLKPKVRSEMKI